RVIDADRLAREAVAPGTAGLSAIVARFGETLLDNQGHLDRPKLGRIVFADAEARKDLEAIVHPEVARLAADQIQQAEREGAELVVYDVPLLYENRLDEGFETVVVVWASLDTRRARIRARDDLPDEEIERRIAAQLPLEDKRRRAQHVIDNEGTLEATRAQVTDLFRALLGDT
ncbi:MAG: dephospho-CoA kinase, partial [Myxococcota bacterium]